MTTTLPSWTRAISVLVPMSIARRGAVDWRQARRGDDGEAVGAHEAGDRRREVDAGLGVHGKTELGGAQRHRRRQGRREGRAAETDRRDAERQVVHGGVADDRHVVEVARRDRLPRAQRGQQLVDAAARRPAQVVEAAVVDRLREAGDHVLAEAHLGILEGLLVDQPPARQVEQVGDDLGRAHVDGDAVGRLAGVGRLDVDGSPFVARDHDAVAAVAQRRRQARAARRAAGRRRPRRPATARGRRGRRPGSAARGRRSRARPPGAARRGAAARWSGSGGGPAWRAPRC